MPRNGHNDVDTIDLPALPAPVESKVTKIAILGTTPSRMEAPIADPDWQIWTIGPGGKDAHRWDRLYETHTVWPEDFAAYLNDLSLVAPPQQVRSIVPMAKRMEHWAARWGHDEVWLKEKITGQWAANSVIDREEMFTRYRRMWFSTSICYAIAEAMEDHVARGSVPHSTTLGLWGIDLESDEEYISQFVGAAHFLDICRLIGIDIVMPAGCGLERDLNPYPDRYETLLALTYEKKLKLLAGLMGQCESEMEGKRMMLHRIEGAIMKLQEMAGRVQTTAIALKASNPELVTAIDALGVKLGEMLSEQIGAGQNELGGITGEFHSLRDRFHQLRGEKSASEYYQRMFTWGMFDANRQL